jgi:hypothetical protein
VVHVRGKTGKTTILIILADEDMDDGNARMSAIVRYNLDVSYGDKIRIMPCLDINNEDPNYYIDYTVCQCANGMCQVA